MVRDPPPVVPGVVTQVSVRCLVVERVRLIAKLNLVRVFVQRLSELLRSHSGVTLAGNGLQSPPQRSLQKSQAECVP